MPVRKMPKYGAQKNLGKFSSVKTGRVAWYESLNERDYMYLLDFDPGVSYWHEQPLKIRFMLGGKIHRYTPDLEVHRDSRKQIVEVKAKAQVESGEWDFLFRTASSICKEEECEYVVVTDDVIRQEPRLESVKKLWKYARTPVHSQHQILCSELFRLRQVAQIELGDLFQLCKVKSVPVQCLYALLFWGVLDFDVTQPLDHCNLISLPSSIASPATKRKAS
jgi:TnsA endonuclease N terminal